MFDKLTALKVLLLNYNRLSSVPAGVFDNLTEKLMLLDMGGNASMTCLPFIPSPPAVWICPICTSVGAPDIHFAACGAAVTVTPIEVTMPKGTTSQYTVVLDAHPRGDVLVTPASGATAIATVPEDGALTFTTDNWSTPQTVTVNGVAAGIATISHTTSGGGYDNTKADDVTATVTATGAGLETETETETDTDTETETGTETGIGTDDCGCTPSLGLTLSSVTLDEGSTAQYAVSLTQAPSDDVTVMVSGSDDGAVTVSPLVLTFTPSNWNTAQTVTLSAVQDPDTMDETVTLTHTASGGGFAGESATFTAMAAVTDDDVPALVLSATSATLAEGGEEATYTVALATLPTAAVTVGSPDEEAVAVSPVLLTFTPSDWDTAQPVTLNAVEDFDAADETVTLTHTASGGGYDGVLGPTSRLR